MSDELKSEGEELEVEYVPWWRAFLSRKFITSLVVCIVLMLVFIVMVKNDLLNEITLGSWLVALLATFGIYTEGNIRAK